MQWSASTMQLDLSNCIDTNAADGEGDKHLTQSRSSHHRLHLRLHDEFFALSIQWIQASVDRSTSWVAIRAIADSIRLRGFATEVDVTSARFNCKAFYQSNRLRAVI